MPKSQNAPSTKPTSVPVSNNALMSTSTPQKNIGSKIKYRPICNLMSVQNFNPQPPHLNSQQFVTSCNTLHQPNHHHFTQFEPEMTSTPLSLSRASSKDIPDVVQPATLNSLIHSASFDTKSHYEGPIVTVTVQNPRPYTPLSHELPPPTKALGETSEVLTKSSYSETISTRITSNSKSSKQPLIEEVTLTKKNGPLGLSIMGGYDQTCMPFGANRPGIFVSRIVPNGTAASTKKIRVGDRIIKVNGIDLSKATHIEAVTALCAPSDEVKLTIQHDPLPSGWQEIIINKTEDQLLGVEISGGLGGNRVNPYDIDDEGVFISKLLPNSAAMRDGRLKVGMRVIEINNISLLGATSDEAQVAINCNTNSISFIVCNGFNKSMAPNTSHNCPPEAGVTLDSVPGLDSDEDSVDIFHSSNNEVILNDEKSVDEKVLDVVRAAERLVSPPSQIVLKAPNSLKKKKTTTIVLSKYTIHPIPVNEQNKCPEPAYLPCEV